MDQKNIWQMKGEWKVRTYSQFMKEEWVSELSNLLRNNSLSDFSFREKFEKELAEYCGCKYSIAVNSGTSAILIAMMALGLNKNSIVVGPNYGNVAWVNCCKFLGVRPFAIDVRRDIFCLDEERLDRELSDAKFDAVLYINHAGYTGQQLNEVVKVCKKHKAFLLEDSCNALGQWYEGVHAGLRGDIGFLSFGVPKLITCGEGGAILLNDDQLYSICKKLSYQGGWYDDHTHSKIDVGANFVMPMHNAYFLSKQLEDIDELIRMRETVCSYYEGKGIKVKRFHQAPSIYEYVTENVEKIMRMSEKFRVQILTKHYVTHSHLYGFCRPLTPNAKYLEENTVILPNSLNLDVNSVGLVCAAITMGERN